MSEFTPFPKIPRLNRDIVISEKLDGTNASIVIATAQDAPWDGSVGSPTCGLPIAAVAVVGEYGVWAGARNNYRQPGKQDNYGWAGWVQANAGALVALLGPGRHFGEFWGAGIQRRYGLTAKRFSLFNIAKYGEVTAYLDPRCLPVADFPPDAKVRMFASADGIAHQQHKGQKVCACQDARPALRAEVGGVLIEPVPVLYRGPWHVPDNYYSPVFSLSSEFAGGHFAPLWVRNRLEIVGSVAVPGWMKPEGIVVFHEASGQLFKATLEGDEKPKGVAA